MANFNSITSTLQLNERNSMEKSKEFAKEMLSFVQQILEDINKLLITLGESIGMVPRPQAFSKAQRATLKTWERG